MQVFYPKLEEVLLNQNSIVLYNTRLWLPTHSYNCLIFSLTGREKKVLIQAGTNDPHMKGTITKRSSQISTSLSAKAGSFDNTSSTHLWNRTPKHIINEKMNLLADLLGLLYLKKMPRLDRLDADVFGVRLRIIDLRVRNGDRIVCRS